MLYIVYRIDKGCDSRIYTELLYIIRKLKKISVEKWTKIQTENSHNNKHKCPLSM